MKKLFLLLLPSLLLFSGCKPQPNPSFYSSSDLPPSESSSQESSESSSSEHWAVPTIDEILNALLNDSYEVSGVQMTFVDGHEVDSMWRNVLKEGTEDDFDIEYQVLVDSHHLPREYETSYFLSCEGYNCSMYTEENGFWVSSHIFLKDKSDDNPVALDILDSIYDVIADVEEEEQFNWTYDDRTATYYGDKITDTIYYQARLVLCPGFFTSLQVDMDYLDEDLAKVSEVRISNHNETHVEIPKTPINDMYSDILNSYFVFRDCTSFTVERDLHIQDEYQDITQHTLFKLVHDYDTDQLDVKIVINNETTYYYRQTYVDDYVFEYRRSDSDWMVITNEEFWDAVWVSYAIFDFVNILDPFALANAVEEIIELVPGSMTFRTMPFEEVDVLPDTHLKESATYNFEYDVDTYAFESLIIERAGKRDAYAYSDINNTVID